MKKDIFYLRPFAAIILLGIIAMSACKKPTDGIGVVINTGKVFKYSVQLAIQDAANSGITPSNISVSLTGQDAAYIYDFSGHKKFTVYNGSLQFLVDPARTQAGSNIRFYVQLNAPGYLPAMQEIVITPSRFTQQVNIKMTNINQPPTNMQIAAKSFKLTNGALPATAVLKLNQTSLNTSGTASGAGSPVAGAFRGLARTASNNGLAALNNVAANTPVLNEDTTYYDDGVTSVVLPRGTQFYYYKWRQTGTTTETDTIPQKKLVVDSAASAGGTTSIYARLETYYEIQTHTFPVGEWDTIPFNGDSVQVVVSYNTQNTDIAYSAYAYPDGIAPAVPAINLSDGNAVREDELLFKSAVAKRLRSIAFYGKDKNNSVIVSPSAAYHWFTSFAINSDFINPRTGNPVAAGDSLESGINYTTLRTEREAITRTSNGQLRAQIQSADIGLYYQAPYTATYNYSFSCYLNGVPDGENATASANLGLLSMFLYGTDNFSETVACKISSASPIIPTTPKITYYYWNQPAGSIAFTNGMNLFAGFKIPNNNPVSNFNITVVNGKQPAQNSSQAIGFQPTCYIYLYTNLLSGTAYIQNGHWATRIYQSVGQLPPFQGSVVYNGQNIPFTTENLSNMEFTSDPDKPNTYNVVIYVKK